MKLATRVTLAVTTITGMSRVRSAAPTLNFEYVATAPARASRA